MRVDSKRFGAAARAALCAGALALAALAQGCAQKSPAPTTRQEALLAQPTPARSAQATPSTESQTAESPLPLPKGHVNDFAEVMDAETESRLEGRLRRLRERAKIEVAVAAVKTTGGRSVYDYSLALARAWKVGPTAGEGGGGILLLLASEDRKWRIQVTRSLEADLPDEVVGQIGNRMAPALRDGRYGEAVEGCVEDLVKRLVERGRLTSLDAEVIRQGPPDDRLKAAGKK